jgi:hypothetical protein
MKEPHMSDTEQEARMLFAAVAKDIPPGIDLLGGVQARRAAHRGRARMALSAAALAVVAAVTLLTLTLSQAPSALAQLTAAASRMAGQTYQFSAVTTWTGPQGSGTAITRAHFWGAFDPARGVGEQTTSDGAQTRFTGGYTYVTAGGAAGQTKFPGGKSWIRIPGLPPLWAPVTANQQLRLGAGLLSVAETSPQSLFTLLKSVSTVNRDGGASGPGWTGTRYAFSVRIAFGPAGDGPTNITATGTVDVDQQGRVRQFDAVYTLPPKASAPARRGTVKMTFGDFGVQVSVPAPPAGDVFVPGSAPIPPGPAHHSVSVSVPG